MEKNSSSKITYAAMLVAKEDRSYGGFFSEYNPYNTIIYLLQLRESKHKGAENNKLNLFLKVSHKFKYGAEQPVYFYCGPEKLDSLDESILAGLKKEISIDKKEDGFVSAPKLFKNLKELLTQNNQHVHLDRGNDDSQQLYYYSDPTVGFLERFKSLSKTAKVVNFVDGIEISENSNSNKKLNLYFAQKINDKVRDQSDLDNTELNFVKTLLTEAPLDFGYWGAFKSLMKFFSPNFLPEEFGQGLGRLSLKAERNTSNLDIDNESQGDFENLSWIREIIPTSPSMKTIDYMNRRMRRQLKIIGEMNPDLYVSIASNMLIRWDSILTKKSYLPAYVLAGCEPHLDKSQKSRVVYLPIIQEKRLDPHPNAWDSNIKKVKEIFNSVEKSQEALKFCYFILKANNEKIPELTIKNLLLGLSSQVDELVYASYKILPKHIELLLPKLSFSQWQSFFEKSGEDLFNTLINNLIALKEDKKIETVPYLLSNFLEWYFEGADPFKDADRAGPLSNLYLNFLPSYRWNTEDIDKNLIKAIYIFYSLNSEKSYFEKLLGQIHIRFDDLIEIYFEIQSYKKLPSGNLGIFKETILNTCLMSSSFTVEEGIQKCFSSLNNYSEELGWEILEKFKNNKDFSGIGVTIASSIFSWLKDKKESNLFGDKWHSRRIDLITSLLDNYPDLVEEKISDILTNNMWSFTASDKLYILSKNSNPRISRIVWDSLNNFNSYEIKELVMMDKNFLKIVGDLVNIEDIPKSGINQQEVLQKYIENNPSRVKSDLSFGLALAAVPNPRLQETIISQLEKINALKTKWLLLAEIGLPKTILAARKFLESLSNKDELSDCILASIDSSVFAVRDMGLELLDKNSDRIHKEKLLASLSTSDDLKVQARVAEELLIKDSNDSVFDDFDNRVLITRRRNRKAKERIKNRLDSDFKSKNQVILAPKRKEALLNLANGKNVRDREWALNRIASLSMKGIKFDGIDFSETNTRRYE
tara:strand:- start:3310 stop:6261 length:2952 start_codon:yes stop_codon:yes gene_type:complete